MLKLKPLGDRVLIEPLSPEEKEGKTKSGIVIPDTAEKERPEQGRLTKENLSRSRSRKVKKFFSPNTARLR